MGKTNAKEMKSSFAETCASINSGVITIFLLLLVTGFPLIYHHSYVDILETKYKFYYVTVLAMLAVLLLLSLAMLFVDRKEYKGQHAKELFSGLKPKNWKTTFSAADAGVILFWVFCVISTLQSEYFYEAFWGNEGRYSGLFLITLYVAFYFVVSRFWNMKWWILELFLASGLVMCYIGITDYFQLDILNFRGMIRPKDSAIFTSTVGNINTYTAYVALLMGVAVTRFATVKDIGRSVWYFVCVVVTFFAIIMGCSDNAYLALGGMFAFLPFMLFRSKQGTLRYLITIAAFATVIQCIDYINVIFADMVIGLDGLFAVLVNLSVLPVIVIGLWLLVAVLYYFWYRSGGKGQAVGAISDDPGRGLVRVWGAFILAAVLAVCFMLFDANVSGNGARYGTLANYLVFNDHWGTNRGFIWRASLEMYQKFKPIHRVFGYGPDTFGLLTTSKIFDDMLNVTGQRFDAAHNEYLHFLLTVGPVALAGYLVFQIGSCWTMVKNRAKNPYILACMVAVLCYGCQALVNLNLPIATPMMWLLLSVGVGMARRK